MAPSSCTFVSKATSSQDGTAVSVPSAASRCLAFSVPVQLDGFAAGLWAGYGLSAACWILETLSSADGLPSYQISGHCCHHLTCACAATTNADIYFCKPKYIQMQVGTLLVVHFKSHRVAILSLKRLLEQGTVDSPITEGIFVVKWATRWLPRPSLGLVTRTF